mmetsp:Transcript_6010/g.8500  ORF Transcript_6010/g.8500 Transcript_6010/m.8500 type:complete len:277 (+) Transcript_6010:147-977(+)
MDLSEKKVSIIFLLLTILHLYSCHVDAFTPIANQPQLLCFAKKPLLSSRPVQTVNQRNSLGKSPSSRSFTIFSAKVDDAEICSVPSSMAEAVDRFFFGPDRGPRIILVLIAAMMFWRASFGSFTTMDAAIYSGTIVFWWFQEHFLHQKLLHSKQNWIGKEIHQSHHDNAYFSVSIDPAPLMVGWLLVATLIFRVILPEPLSLTASLAYACAGMFYEWTHYIVHTRVKPPNEFWKRVRDHHVRHHQVNSNFWFGFSLPMIDDIFGTNPPITEARKKT